MLRPLHCLSLVVVVVVGLLLIGTKLATPRAHAAARGADARVAPVASVGATLTKAGRVSEGGVRSGLTNSDKTDGAAKSKSDDKTDGAAKSESDDTTDGVAKSKDEDHRNTKSDSEDKDEFTNITLHGTVIQTEQDLPEEMSEEERRAKGAGKVPIHREGAFRSPMANPGYGGPTMVKVGLVISEIRDYQIQTGQFSADFFLSFTGNKDFPKLHPIFTNGHDVDCGAIIDAPTFRFHRCSGTFTSEVDLRRYPFDTQTLDIDLEDAIYGVDTIVFEADPQRTSLDSRFRLTGYGVASLGATSFRHQYPPRFDRDDLYVSRYRFTLGLDRFAASAAFTVYVPAFIIVLIALIGLWVPPTELEVRSNAGAPMLAAAVLFHYSLTQALPATGYLTRADKLMLGVYLCLLFNMATTWGFMIVNQNRVMKLFRFFRAWGPPVTAIIMGASVVL